MFYSMNHKSYQCYSIVQFNFTRLHLENYLKKISEGQGISYSGHLLNCNYISELKTASDSVIIVARRTSNSKMSALFRLRLRWVFSHAAVLIDPASKLTFAILCQERQHLVGPNTSS